MPLDVNKERDEIQDLLVEAYCELNILCFKKAKTLLERASKKLDEVIEVEYGKKVEEKGVQSNAL